ncbi:heterokaryon incompatibility protein-domain-containing protein [Truncatella angustata]|uniref:Heterokaryon incompatibility protein-domain-containing protein n=1 Tax=Truncatella angustata TaxID=152316 RepID=A0A9P8RJF6_9PEZI|nr:heterokaryon incompatibility protein-domain-containing protein [Truncatella angustata]KAH6647148.1 heterokaryon incompatibility protein-domain-containing protein [Truncatella angustata]
MLPYVFRPFPKSGYIRTLALEPGAYDDDIVIHMSRVPFDPAHPPYYEALSYFWGSNTNKKPIYVGKQGGSIIMVTRNLEVALRHLRPRHGSSRIMWIDAICINQADDEEKGPQVAKMGQIFKHAARVTAWLGPEQNSSDQAMRLMGYLGSQVSVAWPPFHGSSIPWSMRPTPTAFDKSLGDKMSYLPFSYPETQSIYHLLSRRWFRRLWVRQEIFLATGKAVLVCGSFATPWALFRNAMVSIYCKPCHKVPRGWSRLKTTLSSFIFQTFPVRITTIRQLFDGSECRDSRDRIYAILDLLHDLDRRLNIQPDYTKSTASVYKCLTRMYIEKSRSVKILQDCQIDTNIKNTSWVPDWTAKLETEQFTTMFASSQLASDFVLRI